MSSNNLVRISAAGSGKTWRICHDALETAYKGKHSLITTYTNNGVESIKNEICNQNSGVLHENIEVKSWFQFLLSELIRPYQTVIAGINEIKGFDFSNAYGFINYGKTGSKKRYIKPDGRVISNNASELALLIMQKSSGAAIRRLENCYDSLYIDEVQDLAGYDLNIVHQLFQSEISITCAGDNKQATYKTHNAKKNKAKSGANIWDFFSDIQSKGIADIERNLDSRRCNGDICSFANMVFSNENNISSISDIQTEHDGVYLISSADAKAYCNYYSPQILRYDMKTTVEGCVLNFGQCKGMTFDRVMIYPNGPFKEFICKRKGLSSPYKYYVAVTRPRHSLTFVLDDIAQCSTHYTDVEVCIGHSFIKAKKYVNEG